MKPLRFLLPLSLFVHFVAFAAEAPPAKALKYHEALLKRPSNDTLFDRFFGAWIDEQDIAELEIFLKARAEENGGADLSILARYQLRRGNENEAIETLGKAITALPNEFSLPMARAKVLLRRLEFEDARKDLETVAAGTDANLAIEASKLIGKSHLREGDPAATAAAWEKLLKAHPSNQDLLEDLVELAAASEQLDQAIAYSERLIKATVDPFKKAQRNIRLGELLALSGEIEKAVALWSATLAQTGEGSWLEREIIARIGKSYRRQDRIDSLAEKLAELAAANPRRLLIHLELAKLEAAGGKLDSAIGRFREVLRRSPGNVKLREEFIRLLVDGERFTDASDELVKMISLSPRNPELHLRMADLAHRKWDVNPDRPEDSPPEVLASLEKALSLLPLGEPSGIRIAGLMNRYGFEKNGETLLSKLSAAEDATSAPAEALAAEYARTNRKKEALIILTEVAKSPDSDTVLRVSSSISSLGDPEAAFGILATRLADFPNRPAHLAALAKASLVVKKPEEALAPALRLVRLAELPQEIIDTTRLATSVIAAAEKTPEQITSLTDRKDRTPSETCLLASLLETQPDHDAADALFTDASDPTLLRFHASLLSRRGDFPAAIAAFELLAESSEGGRASFFKELSELQLRAGLNDDCLATLDQWKIAAPTAKTPWVIATRLLRESGKIEEAIETTRRALARFSGDEDFSANLAGLYRQIGENSEAERIFWRLYDQAPDPTAQSRWAARLSDLARSTGATAELKEKFTARARSNSRSLGPILALVELARTANDKKAISEHLAQALRIKPSDTGIRLQLAQAEANAGNPDTQIEVLSEGVANDPAGRVRNALAQAYIGRGEIMKGMRMLRALAGERGSDPRSVEQATISLARTGMLAEAIQYLGEALPDGGDWHSRFLLATLLTQDGREREAIHVFLSLLDVENEIPGLAHNPNSRHQSNFSGYLRNSNQLNLSIQPTAETTLNQLLSAVRQDRHSYSPRRGRNPYTLPTSAPEVRLRSLVRLATLASLGDPEISSTIEAAGIEDISFLVDAAKFLNGSNPDYLSLLAKHPTRPGLFQYSLQIGILRERTPEKTKLLKRLLSGADLNPFVRFQATSLLINQGSGEAENWDMLISAASDSVSIEAAPAPYTQARTVCHQLIQLLTGNKPSITPARRAKIKEILLSHLAAIQNIDSPNDNSRLYFLAVAGTTEQWIEAINDSVLAHRAGEEERLAAFKKSRANPLHQRYYRLNFAIPNLQSLPFTSVPMAYLQSIAQRRQHGQNDSTISTPDLLDKIDLFDSPLIRAWIAVRSGDEKAIAKTLSVTPTDAEKGDFLILRSSLATQDEKYPEACRVLVKVYAGSDQYPWIQDWARNALIGVATTMPADQRKEFNEALRAALTALTPTAQVLNQYLQHGSSGHSSQMSAQLLAPLEAKAKLFGFEDLVKTFSPSPPLASLKTSTPRTAPARLSRPAAITPSRTATRSTRATTPLKRFQTFAREEKNTAAARELLLWIRNSASSGGRIGDVIARVRKSITEPIHKELLAMADPGIAPGIAKRLAYAEICLALGEQEKGLTVYRTLAKERPFDPSITIALAFLLPPGEIEDAAELLKRSANSVHFQTISDTAIRRVTRSRDDPAVFAFYDLITNFLEATDPTETDYRSLSWIPARAYQCFTGSLLKSRASLIKPGDKEKPNAARHAAIGKRLALAMLRHPCLAESGFRLLNSAAWETKPEELDAWARDALLLGAGLHNIRNRISQNIANNKSSAAWLLLRLEESESPDNIIPPAYVAALSKANPSLPPLLKFIASTPTSAELAELWNSGAMEPGNNNNNKSSLSFLRSAAHDHAVNTPGSDRFFLDRIRSMSSKKNRTNVSQSELNLFRTALRACASRDEKGVREMCSAISAAFFGEDGKNPNTLNIFQNLFQQFTTDFVTHARIVRAFDSPKTPMGSYVHIHQSVQQEKIDTPKKAVEMLASIGLLDNASSWKPLATYVSKVDYSSGQARSTSERIDLGENVTNNLSNKPEIIALLEKRKPRTFGALITAASISKGSERSRHAAAAFKLAAPTLAKLPPERLEDFGLLLDYLPEEAIPTLPPLLRDKAQDARDAKIEQLTKAVETRFTSNRSNPNSNPFNGIDSFLVELANLNLEKSVDFFLNAERMFAANPPTKIQSRTNAHEESLQRILNALGSNSKSGTDTALRFYVAVRNSPQGSHFGICNGLNSKSYLSTVGRSITQRHVTQTRPDGPKWSHPWLAADALAETLRSASLAAAVCSNLEKQYARDTKAERKGLANDKQLSTKARDFAIACAGIRGWLKDNNEERTVTSGSFLTMLADPDLSPDARTQIALTAAAKFPVILTDPPIATTISEIFSAHCAEDRSTIDKLSIAIINAIHKLPDECPTLPQLKRIHSAFWENANSPKTGGHPDIQQRSVSPMFHTALRLGDAETAQRLFPFIQPALTGNLSFIVSMISGGHFEFAAALIPDDNTPFQPVSSSTRYTPEFQERLTVFGKSTVNPARLLRLECALLAMRSADGNTPTPEFTAERRKHLTACYAANPPSTSSAKIEILHALAVSTDPASDILSAELIELADLLDPAAIMNDWANSKEKPKKLTATSKWDILCKVAAIRLASGDAAPFVTLIAAVPKVSKLSDDRYSAPNLALDRILSYILPATCAAISDRKTGGFSALIQPLGSIAVSLSKPRIRNGEQIVATLALCELLAYWEGTPVAFSRFLEQINGDAAEKLEKTFSFPRYSPPFLDALARYNRGGHLSVIGPMPEGFPLAFFSHPPISDLLPSDSKTWHAELARSNLKDTVAKLALEEFPESITPAGRTILLLYRDLLLRNLGRGNEVPAAYRASLVEMPLGKPWNSLRTFAKCRLASVLLNANMEIEEAQTLLNSIKPAEVSRSHKSFYESLLKRIKTKESRSN